MKSDRTKGLIKVLLDRSASIADRDDAAMDLGDYDDPEVLDALIAIAVNANDEELVLASCGQSIAEIWIRKNIFNVDILEAMSIPAKNEIVGLVRIERPEWLGTVEGHLGQ